MGVNGIYGLSGSGLDIESLVKAGMLPKQREYDKLYKKTVKQQWMKEAFSNLYSDLMTFKFKTLSDFKSQSKLNAMGASSSNKAVVTATANGAAVAMTHKVRVNSLSTNAYLLTGEAGITRANTEESAKNSMKLSDNVFSSLKDNGDGTFTYKLADGTEKTVNGDDVAVSFSLGDTPEALTEDQKKKQTVTYTFADLAGGKTYNDLAADINAMGTNIKASYDSTTDSFSLYNSVSGSDAAVNLTVADEDKGGAFAATLLNNLNLKASANGTLSDIDAFASGATNTTKGQEGSVTIDGKTYTDVKDNRITAAGVTYNLLDVSEPGKTVTVSVSQDTEAIIKTVKDFVEEYNKVLDKLQEKFSTKTWSNDDLENDYEPLTKSEQANMTSEQIESWNEKAKSGLLYHDPILRGLINGMRDAISSRVESVGSEYNSASAIGITSSDNQGHLTLDEDKLKKALAADPDCVYQIFANDQDNYAKLDKNQRYDYVKREDYNNRGILNRLYYDAVTDGLRKINQYAGMTAKVDDQTPLGNTIVGLQKRLDALKVKMTSYQEMLFKKYDAMENAIFRQNSMYGAMFGGNG